MTVMKVSCLELSVGSQHIRIQCQLLQIAATAAITPTRLQRRSSEFWCCFEFARLCFMHAHVLDTSEVAKSRAPSDVT